MEGLDWRQVFKHDGGGTHSTQAGRHPWTAVLNPGVALRKAELDR